MPHEHVTVTLDAETVADIQADLEPGESVAARVRAIVEGRHGEDDERYGGDDGRYGADGDDRPADDQGDYDPVVEFVDDCSV